MDLNYDEVEPTLIGLPESLTNYFSSNASHHLEKRESTGRFFSSGGYSSGCQDNYAIFAFLAFALAVLDVILEMNMRRKRSVTETLPVLPQNDESRNATIATYTMFRGFLNAISTNDENCQRQFMCESGLESSKYGRIGKQISILSSGKVQELMSGKSGHFVNFKTAVREGLNGSCKYDCKRYPEPYRFPGVSQLEDGEDDALKLYSAIAALQPVQQNIEEKFKKTNVF